jgi:U3 small nucleolar RNA-associated protein 22
VRGLPGYRVYLEGTKMREEDRVSILESGSYVSSVLPRLDRILRQALGDRVRAVAILHPSSTRRPLNQDQPTLLSTVDVGLILDPKQALRLVDHGPHADDDEQLAQIFRDFWGEKSELRRFKDGTIQESVVWEVKPPTERVHIPLRIVEHVMLRHFEIKRVESIGPSYDALLAIPPSIGKYRGISESTSGFHSAMHAFDELLRGIKAMDLPLSLVSCTPVAEGLRYTSVFSPVPIPTSRLGSMPECARYTTVHEAILMFEKSAKWPDDLGAIQKLKLAWFENLARLVMDKFDGSRAEVAIDDGTSPIEDNASLEALLPEGHAFRLRIYHDREKTLLERKLNDKTVQGFDRHEAQMALDLHVRRFIHAPQHHATIMNMHYRYTGWSPSVRLVKRWCAAHMLSLHICPEVIELLVAHVFLRTDPHTVPHSGPSGFVRTLDFIRNWNWKEEPLIVPLYAAAGLEDPDAPAVFSKEKNEQAQKAFKESRALDPGMSNGAWFIATEEDTRSTRWAGQGNTPTPMIADRLRMLAKACIKCLEQGMEAGRFDVKVRFISCRRTNLD